MLFRQKKNAEDKKVENTIIMDKNKESYSGIIEKGSVYIIDTICSSFINTTSPDYVIIDGVYMASILIVDYPHEVTPGWLLDIINFGEGVETSIYYNMLDRHKVIKELTQYIGETGAKRKASKGNARDLEHIDQALEDTIYMRQQINIENEDLYYLHVLILAYADSEVVLKERIKAIETRIAAMNMSSRTADYRHEDGMTACMPLYILDDGIKKATRRNILTKGLASTYPFGSYEFCDNNGIFIGLNEHNNSIVMVDIFNTELYKNANMVLLGTSGAGKTFLMQLMALRLRMQDIPVMIIAPLKGFEFENACRAIGGQFISISAASNDCINIMEIREISSNTNFDGNIMKEEQSLLLAKIQKLHIFFSLVFKDMTDEEQQYLDEKLIQTYKYKGITFNNKSLYKDISDNKFSVKGEFKEMPVLEDLYNILESDIKTKRMATLLKRLVHGSLKSFNQQTNVDLKNNYIVADISDLKGRMLPIGMFIVVELFWDRIKQNRNEKKAIFIDELWNLIGSTGNKQAAEFVFEIFKTIRGYGGAAIGGTQDISDFFSLEDGRYGKGIINNSKMKVVLQLEEEDVHTLEKVLKLSEEEMARIVSFPRGHGLFYAGSNHLAVEFRSSVQEKALITTDRIDIERMKIEE